MKVSLALTSVLAIFISSCSNPTSNSNSSSTSSKLILNVGTQSSLSSSRSALSRAAEGTVGSISAPTGVEFRFGLNSNPGSSSLWIGNSTDVTGANNVSFSVYRTDLGSNVGSVDADSEIYDPQNNLNYSGTFPSKYFLVKASSTGSTGITTTIKTGTLIGQFDEGIIPISGGNLQRVSSTTYEDYGVQFVVTNSDGVSTSHFGYGVGYNGTIKYLNSDGSYNPNSGWITLNKQELAHVVVGGVDSIVQWPNTISTYSSTATFIGTGGNFYIIFVPSSWLPSGVSALGIDTAYNLTHFANAAAWAAANPGITTILNQNSSNANLASELFGLFQKWATAGAISVSSSYSQDIAAGYELIPMSAVTFASGNTVTLNLAFNPTVSGGATPGYSLVSTSPLVMDVEGVPPIPFSITQQ